MKGASEEKWWRKKGNLFRSDVMLGGIRGTDLKTKKICR